MALGYNGQSLEAASSPSLLSSVIGLVGANGLASALGINTLKEVLADFGHADKIFNSNSFANAPKQKFLFHVSFDINPQAYTPNTPDQTNMIGILVRDIKLPSYTIATHQLNQYNRKRIVQTKIKYDPVNISFHDDMNNTIAKMWAAYYTYYYADGSLPGVAFSGNTGTAAQAEFAPPAGGATTVATMNNYDLRTQYLPNSALPNTSNWGYIGETNVPSASSSAKVPFFKKITIFGLMRHNFLAYTLINPIITNFQHDTYSYDDGAGVMRNTMNIDYETVVYNEGSLDGTQPSNIVTGFGMPDSYDLTPSPITRTPTQGYVISNNGVVPGPSGGQVQSLRRPSILNPSPNSTPPASTTTPPPNQPSSAGANSGAINSQVQNAATNNNNGTRNAPFTLPGASTSPGPAGLASSPGIAPNGGALSANPPNILANVNPLTGQVQGPSPTQVVFGSSQAGAPSTAGTQVTGVDPILPAADLSSITNAPPPTPDFGP